MATKSRSDGVGRTVAMLAVWLTWFGLSRATGLVDSMNIPPLLAAGFFVLLGSYGIVLALGPRRWLERDQQRSANSAVWHHRQLSRLSVPWMRALLLLMSIAFLALPFVLPPE